jgi:hypothetical protein
MATNTNNIEDEVRRRAYELWEQYGRPESGEKEFWLKAEREIKQAKGLNGTAPESSKSDQLPPGASRTRPTAPREHLTEKEIAVLLDTLKTN